MNSFAVTPREAAAPLIAVVDVGTSSCRAFLFDAEGRQVTDVGGIREHALTYSADGAADADPDELCSLVFACLDDLASQAGDLALTVDALAGCTFAGSLVGVDGSGRACTRLISYADTRPAAFADVLRDEVDENQVHDRTGCRLHPAYLPAQLRWLERSQPESYRQIERIVGLGEYLSWQWLGEPLASLSAASWTGLLDRRKRVWDRPLLGELGLRAGMLPRLDLGDGPAPGLTERFAARWPALAGVRVFPLVADGAAANIGSGCIDDSRVAVTVGTSSAVRVVLSEQPQVLPAGLWCYRVDSRRVLLGGALSEGGNVLAWLRTVLQLPEPEELERALGERPADGHGLSVLPLLAGERSPGWVAAARASIHGLGMANDAIDIVRACLEAVALRLGLVFQLLNPALSGRAEVVASGGALTRSPTWLQMVADVFDRPVQVSPAREASARGAALLALDGLGCSPGDAAIADPEAFRFEPDSGRHSLYRQASERQQELYAKLVRNQR